MSKPSDILVLLAAGFARRMQKVIDDKITATLLNKPVFFYSLNAFYATGKIEKVVITYRDSEQLEKIQTAYATFDFPNWKVEYVLGGESRQASVLAALETCADHQGLVHIHDGARPLITPASINLVLKPLNQAQPFSLEERQTPLRLPKKQETLSRHRPIGHSSGQRRHPKYSAPQLF